jgi:RimJ/RimL family protein N-acetyltransferase
MVLTTPRLKLRRWKKEDYEPFAAMNMDPQVMEFFPATLSKEESLFMIERNEARFEKHHYGLYAAERLDNKQFIGYIGFSHPQFEAPFTPCVEIGWRLSKENWNQGFATEGAVACLNYGFSVLGFKTIYSWTSVLNLPSMAVMRKAGMEHAGQFEHPSIADGHRLKTHVLYRKDNLLTDSNTFGN